MPQALVSFVDHQLSANLLGYFHGFRMCRGCFQPLLLAVRQMKLLNSHMWPLNNHGRKRKPWPSVPWRALSVSAWVKRACEEAQVVFCVDWLHSKREEVRKWNKKEFPAFSLRVFLPLPWGPPGAVLELAVPAQGLQAPCSWQPTLTQRVLCWRFALVLLCYPELLRERRSHCWIAWVSPETGWQFLWSKEEPSWGFCVCAH